MGLQQSKEELLYQQVNYGNIAGIKALHSQGAGLEDWFLGWGCTFVQWMDKEGKTPLIVACLRHDLLPVAKILIELGANVNVYRPGEKLRLSRTSLFTGWLREVSGPGFLEAFVPQLWAVILPCDARNPTRPLKFELAIYSDLQV
ncbi:hypothetical protein GW17_00018168 [Ensete ventricosum]|nr:hypothetical protein GW17_00018168 [Ensete ventricosum]